MTLRQYISGYSPVPYNTIREIAYQLLLGLAQTHKSGIIHCDLKPSNIM